MVYRLRALSKTGGFILLGLVISVGVAWFYSARTPSMRPSSIALVTVSPAGEICSEVRGPGWSVRQFVYRDQQLSDPVRLLLGDMFTTSLLYESKFEAEFDRRVDESRLWGGVDDRGSVTLQRAVGWPMVCLWQGQSAGQDYVMPHPASIQWEPLPWRPVWRGVVFNAIFYAVLCAAPLPMWRWARARVRRSRRGCPGCGYSLRDLPSPRCPECGYALVTPDSERQSRLARMRRFSRNLLLPGIALFLGAGTAVIVAWGIAIAAGEKIVSPSSDRGMLTEAGIITFGESRGVGRRARWIGNPKNVGSPATPEKVAAIRAEWAALHSAMPRVPWVDRMISWGGLDRPHDWLARRRQYAFGFPVVCVWYERSGGLSMFGSAARLHGGFEVTKKRSGLVAEGAIGYRPIWAGLAINAVVYGVVWMGVMKVVGVWSARRRARVGGCRRCGYSLKELPDGAVCPECGSGGKGKRVG